MTFPSTSTLYSFPEIRSGSAWGAAGASTAGTSAGTAGTSALGAAGSGDFASSARAARSAAEDKVSPAISASGMIRLRVERVISLSSGPPRPRSAAVAHGSFLVLRCRAARAVIRPWETPREDRPVKAVIIGSPLRIGYSFLKLLLTAAQRRERERREAGRAPRWGL